MKPMEVSLQMGEIEILKVASNHPNVIRMLDFFEDSNFIYIVLEYVQGCDLFSFVNANKLDEK